MTKNKLLISFVSGLTLYIISTGLSYAVFSSIKNSGGQAVTSPLASKTSGFKFDVSGPKTEICPINGAKFTKAEKDVWDKRRPITAMIEDHADSRPSSGLQSADAVYEAVAEGGITRFMAVFYCGVAAKDLTIAPVRSARVYYINWAQEYGDYPLYVHVGGANNICSQCPGGVKPDGDVDPRVMAIEYLNELGWRGASGNDFDNTGLPIFQRNDGRLDHEVATEHTMQVYIDKLYAEAENRKLGFNNDQGVPWNKNFVSWKFADDKPTQSNPATSIKFSFWDGAPLYDVEWKYNQANNNYLRYNGGKPFTDLEENNSQIAAKNVVVMYVKEQDTIDKEGHTYIKTVGKGNALVFQNGTVIEGTWEKDSEDGRTIFSDKSGNEITFVRGQIWIEAVPDFSQAKY